MGGVVRFSKSSIISQFMVMCRICNSHNSRAKSKCVNVPVQWFLFQMNWVGGWQANDGWVAADGELMIEGPVLIWSQTFVCRVTTRRERERVSRGRTGRKCVNCMSVLLLLIAINSEWKFKGFLCNVEEILTEYFWSPSIFCNILQDFFGVKKRKRTMLCLKNYIFRYIGFIKWKL